MECIFCGGTTKVISTFKNKNKKSYIRRRKCLECDISFTTLEINHTYLLDILEEYLPQKLIDEISAILTKKDLTKKDF